MNKTEKGWFRRTLDRVGEYFKRKYDAVRGWILGSQRLIKLVNLRNNVCNNVRKHRTLWFVGSIFVAMTAAVLTMNPLVGIVGLAVIASGTILFSGPDVATGAYRLLEVLAGFVLFFALALSVSIVLEPIVAAGALWAVLKITIVLGVAAYLHTFFRAERYNMEVAHFAAQTKGKQLGGIEEVRKAAAIVRDKTPRL